MSGQPTPLDLAFAAMGQGGDAARLGFYQRLADTELVIWLEADSDGRTAAPKTLNSDGQDYVLAFDLEERLADMAGAPEPCLVLPGRALAHMLAGQATGIALNMGDAPSAMLIPAPAVDWLAETLSEAAVVPGRGRDLPQRFLPPADLPAGLIGQIAQRLVAAGAGAGEAWTCTAVAQDGRARNLLAIIGAAPVLEKALADTVNEAMLFSGADDLEMDVAFVEAGDGAAAGIRSVGRRIDMPVPDTRAPAAPSGPGMNPDRPPRLR